MLMPSGYTIVNSLPADIGTIFQLFDSAIAYQEKHNYPLWPRFSRAFILEEISEKRHWKIVWNDTIVCIFSVMYTDPVIWGKEQDAEPSVYLHRIAVHPQFKGRNMMLLVKEWAREHAVQNGKRFVRMDTWGHNWNLRRYYIGCGFDYLGQRHLEQRENEPAHYGGSILSLFQLKV